MWRNKGNFVKFLCVDVKAEESQDKLKAKVLKAIYSSEKKATPTPITHPLQPWNEDAHTFPELRSAEVTRVVANSGHVAFLLKDGRVCCVRVASWVESTSKMMNVDALRQSQRGSSFQVLGDEEYAQQLQAELNSGQGGWSVSDPAGNRRWSSRPGGMFLETHGTLPGSVPPSVLDDNVLSSEWR